VKRLNRSVKYLNRSVKRLNRLVKFELLLLTVVKEQRIGCLLWLKAP
jgi:hypothetical protein